MSVGSLGYCGFLCYRNSFGWYSDFKSSNCRRCKKFYDEGRLLPLVHAIGCAETNFSVLRLHDVGAMGRRFEPCGFYIL